LVESAAKMRLVSLYNPSVINNFFQLFTDEPRFSLLFLFGNKSAFTAVGATRLDNEVFACEKPAVVMIVSSRQVITTVINFFICIVLAEQKCYAREAAINHHLRGIW